MKSNVVRQSFIDFFARKNHHQVPSSSLVPTQDATLLFTNSGMVQFKDVFLGKDQRPYNRAVTAQRCLRAGGKHNDLENVGYTLRHHTFFEMLGNFSFGDYFKKDAIRYAWELLTEVYNLDRERLWATVYFEDEEAYDLWKNDIGIPVSRLVRIGDKPGGERYQSDNFWQMADTGPCGPCSEVFYDHGPSLAGGPPGSPDADGDRYVEIWNLVFMQFNRDSAGVLRPLPRPAVDTGMGLERVSAVLQGVTSNYDIDLFVVLTEAVVAATATTEPLSHPSVKVIADHLRASAFLITDGVLPDNEGRGYVLRRILRRAILHGHKLGCLHPFIYTLVDTLKDQMGAAYPELIAASAKIKDALLMEEERFAQTLSKGLGILEAAMPKKGGVLPGDVAFLLHDTHGFPLDLTADLCRERGVALDTEGFEKAMEIQRERARSQSSFQEKYDIDASGITTAFHGYDHLHYSARVTGLQRQGMAVEVLQKEEEGLVFLDATSFYGESGGQVGDRGEIEGPEGTFLVLDTQKFGKAIAHLGRMVRGTMRSGHTVEAKVDQTLRGHTARNHSVTHLMHKALRTILGDHVHQRGSLVNEHLTRFDFSHGAALNATQIHEIEALVNKEIISNSAVVARLLPKAQALAMGAMALFGEKYDDTVRMLDIGNSCELCGGTHVLRTGDIGLFKIVGQEAVAAGVRRVTGVTGLPALKWVQNQESALHDIAATLKAPLTALPQRTAQALTSQRALEKEVATLKARLVLSQSDSLVASARVVEGVYVLVRELPGLDATTLRKSLDTLLPRLQPGVVVLTSTFEEKINLIVGVSKTLTTRLMAKDVAQEIAGKIGGKAGGRADLAQGGGVDLAALPAAITATEKWLEQRLHKSGTMKNHSHST